MQCKVIEDIIDTAEYIQQSMIIISFKLHLCSQTITFSKPGCYHQNLDTDKSLR